MASRLKEDIMINKNNETEELLVFGYSCKLFRDDEKALYIDQGKHLIPWMGDESLKIDRYDARGTLFDLKQAEAPIGGFDRYFGLTDLERQVEVMCDDERYRALITNEEEETMYQEEELKRLHYAINDKGNSYGQVEYKYDGDINNIVENNTEKNIERSEDVADTGEDEPFVPSPLLDIPVNTVLPETVKHNAIIEKTAMFISNQGPQMEILLKMKQAGNPQFNFLSFDNPLHNYYRHLLMAIKGGRYKPEIEHSDKKEDLENEEDDHYLHPSLAASVSKVELAPSIPSINYKPSAHCAYSMLVNKIKDKKLNEQGAHLSNFKDTLEKFNDKKNEENPLHEKCQYLNNQCSKAQSFPTPPNDMQIIIDKMASYVAKNGRDFETVVKMKNDPRFDFLNSSHMYNSYYQHKVKQYESLEKSSKIDMKNRVENASVKLRDDQSKNKLAPVCFSIKKPKDSEPVIEKSALPVEESSDEEGKEEKKLKDGGEEKEKEGKSDVVTIDLAAQEEKEEKNKKILAAEKLKDKLTAAVREKVAMASKEKQLQLDRKRRAAAFLKNIHSESGAKSQVVYGPQLPREASNDRDAEENSDVASLPDAADDVNESRNVRKRSTTSIKHKHTGHEKHDKRHRSSGSEIHHKHREKHRSKADKTEKSNADESRAKELMERISESSSSSEDEDKKRGFHWDKTRKSEDGQWKNKTDRIRSFNKDEKRRKRKKHKKDDIRQKSSRKHSKMKKQKRSRESDDNRNSRNKRSRRNSTSTSSENQNS